MTNTPANALQPLRMAVLASGEGMTLQALMAAIAAGELPATVVGVLSNRANAGALARARAAGISTALFSAAEWPDVSQRDLAMAAALQAWQPDVVVTAGYMQRLGPATLAAFHRRMINVHPSLLPAYGGQGMYGRRVHEAVVAAGEPESGASVHYVEGDYDSGPLIAQVRVPVLPGDTAEALEARVKAAEQPLLVTVLRQRALNGAFPVLKP